MVTASGTTREDTLTMTYTSLSAHDGSSLLEESPKIRTSKMNDGREETSKIF